MYYTSWWDFSGIEFEIGGIDPNCRHPKPRPTSPHDLFDSFLFLYQKEIWGKIIAIIPKFIQSESERWDLGGVKSGEK